jgi:hypothetical protein
MVTVETVMIPAAREPIVPEPRAVFVRVRVVAMPGMAVPMVVFAVVVVAVVSPVISAVVPVVVSCSGASAYQQGETRCQGSDQHRTHSRSGRHVVFPSW